MIIIYWSIHYPHL